MLSPRRFPVFHLSGIHEERIVVRIRSKAEIVRHQRIFLISIEPRRRIVHRLYALKIRDPVIINLHENPIANDQSDQPGDHRTDTF